MTKFRYNFNDIYYSSHVYKTKHYGVVKIFRLLYHKNWKALINHGRKNILDSSRWCNYILNAEGFLMDNTLSIMDKAIIIKIASYRDYGNWVQHGDNSIKLERIKDIPIERLEQISLINIKNDKIYLTFENDK